jgi:hypothetical protein
LGVHFLALLVGNVAGKQHIKFFTEGAALAFNLGGLFPGLACAFPLFFPPLEWLSYGERRAVDGRDRTVLFINFNQPLLCM